MKKNKFMNIKVTEEEAEQLFGEIDNQGFGYWLENYGYKGNDKELERLCKEGNYENVKEYIDNIDQLEKTYEVSFLCGAKQMIEGHHLRHRLHKRGDEITIPKQWHYTLEDYTYNNGNHTIVQYEGQTPGSEKKKLWNSMFSICVENSSNRSYHTEKIIDAFLSKTVPVYWGCPNLEELGYDPNGFIYCENEDEIIKEVNKLTPEDYHNRVSAMDHNFELAQHYANIYQRLGDLLKEVINLNKI